MDETADQVPSIAIRMRLVRDAVLRDDLALAWEMVAGILAQAPDNAVAQAVSTALIRRWRRRLAVALKEARLADALAAAQDLLRIGEHRDDAIECVVKVAPRILSADRVVTLLCDCMDHADENSMLWDALAAALNQAPATEVNIESGFRALSLSPGHRSLLTALAGLVRRYEIRLN